MRYPVVVHKSEFGFDVHCPLLPGCHSQGDTEDEALENIKDAIKTYLEMVSEEAKGYMRDIGNDLWERVDENGTIIGIGILGFKKRLQGSKGEIQMPLSVSFS